MIAKSWITCLLIVYSGFLCASDSRGEGSIQMLANGMAGSEFQLVARQALLTQILDEVARKTAVPLHYSMLPDSLVTASCVGTTLKIVLECLLGPRVDIVFRYSQRSERNKNRPELAEVWLLGTTLGSGPTKRSNCLATDECLADLSALKEQTGDNRTDALLEMAKSDDPALRASALSQLATEGSKDNANVIRTVEQALSDQNAEVRAQSVFALAQLAGEGAGAEIQRALFDSDAAVRLMALDYVENDVALLRQIADDPDRTVRTRVEMKLAELATETP